METPTNKTQQHGRWGDPVEWEEAPPPTDEDAPWGANVIPFPGPKRESEPKLAPDAFRSTPLRELEPYLVAEGDRIWGEVVNRGCLTFLAGTPGAGKSTLTRHLIHAIATGERYFLGMPVTQEACPVLVVDYESPDTFRYSFWQDVFGDSMAEIGNVSLVLNPPRITGIEAVNALMDEVRRIGAGLLVYDTLSAGFSFEDENDNAEAQRIMDNFRTLSKETRTAVIIIHHPAKGGASLRGAGALAGACDTELLFRVEGELGPDGIDDQTEMALVIKKNRVGSMFTTAIKPDGDGGFRAPYSATAEEDDGAMDLVKRILQDHAPRAVKTTQFLSMGMDERRYSNRTMERALRRLMEMGKIHRVGRGTYRL